MTATAKLKAGVYTIIHKDSGKRYIGSSNNMPRRLLGHRAMLKKGNHPNCHLQSAYNKDGDERFIFRPLLVCSLEDRVFYEQICIDSYKATNHSFGYNMSLLAKHPKHSDETKKKIGEKVKLAYSEGRVPGHWQSHTEEARKKMSLARKGKPNFSLRGKKRTEEVKRKMSLSKIGQVAWNKGKKLSAEHTRKSKETKAALFKNSVFLEKWNARKVTHCPKGHSYSGDNLYVNPIGGKDCKICRRDRVEKHRAIHPRRKGS